MKISIFSKIILILCIFAVSPIPSQSRKSEPAEVKEAKKSYSQKSYATALKQFQSYADKNPND